MDYASFLAGKRRADPPTGVADLPPLTEALFPFQADIVRWALRRGRAGVFAGTGLGKTLIELAWGDAIVRATGGMVLHLAPLAVSAQVIREAGKFGIPARQVRDQPLAQRQAVVIGRQLFTGPIGTASGARQTLGTR